MTSSIFNEEEFWAAFTRDMEAARGRVLIQSPFVSARRVKLLAKTFRALTGRAITVCLFVQEPRNWTAKLENLDPDSIFRVKELKLAIEMLQSWDIHVNLRRSIHAKFAVIDETLLWEGSLNILSHADTKEHMRRWESKSVLRATVEKYFLEDCSACATNLLSYGTSPKPPGRLVGLGILLTEHRRRLNLSRRAFAARCALPHSRIARIEDGKNTTLSCLLTIVDKLDLEMLFVPKLLVPSVTRLLRQTNTKQLAANDTKSPRAHDDPNSSLS